MMQQIAFNYQFYKINLDHEHIINFVLTEHYKWKFVQACTALLYASL